MPQHCVATQPHCPLFQCRLEQPEMQAAGANRLQSGGLSEQAESVGSAWQAPDLPPDVFQQILGMLDSRHAAQAQLLCRGWR